MPKRAYQDILVLDRSPDIRALLGEVLKRTGYYVRTLTELPADQRQLGQLHSELIILDHKRGAQSPGLSFLRGLRRPLRPAPSQTWFARPRSPSCERGSASSLPST
jgi:DNA-binding response OmpR family regulator